MTGGDNVAVITMSRACLMAASRGDKLCSFQETVGGELMTPGIVSAFINSIPCHC